MDADEMDVLNDLYDTLGALLSSAEKCSNYIYDMGLLQRLMSDARRLGYRVQRELPSSAQLLGWIPTYLIASSEAIEDGWEMIDE